MKKSILIIEDEYYSVRQIVEALSSMYDWSVAKSGSEAHDYLNRKKFDLLVLDIMMPHGSEIDASIPGKNTGIELLRLIRKGTYKDTGGTSPEVPVIVLTATGELIAWNGVRDLGANETFQKPVKYATIKQAIHNLLKEEER